MVKTFGGVISFFQAREASMAHFKNVGDEFFSISLNSHRSASLILPNSGLIKNPIEVNAFPEISLYNGNVRKKVKYRGASWTVFMLEIKMTLFKGIALAISIAIMPPSELPITIEPGVIRY